MAASLVGLPRAEGAPARVEGHQPGIRRGRGKLNEVRPRRRQAVQDRSPDEGSRCQAVLIQGLTRPWHAEEVVATGHVRLEQLGPVKARLLCPLEGGQSLLN